LVRELALQTENTAKQMLVTRNFLPQRCAPASPHIGGRAEDTTQPTTEIDYEADDQLEVMRLYYLDSDGRD